MNTNFDYVRDDDYNFFIVLGDRHPDDHVIGLPVYTPCETGDRLYEGVRLEKAAKDGSADLAGEPYRESPVTFGALEIDTDRIVETVSPYRDRDTVLENLDDDARDVYDRVVEAVDDTDRLMVIGSDVFDVGTDGSDLDLVWMEEYELFADTYKDILTEEAGLQEAGEDWIEERLQGHAERYGVPEPVADYHHRHPQQRFFTEDSDLKVGFSPSQVPGTWHDYALPDADTDYEPFEEEVTVVNADASGYWPRTVETVTDQGDEHDIVTYFWAYGGSFSAGDRVAVRGDLFPADDTVYLREPGHYAAPSAVLDDSYG